MRSLALRRLVPSFVILVLPLVAACGATPPAPAEVVLSKVEVSGAAALVAGATLQLTATATYSDGTTSNATATATWRSSAETIATVSGGLVTAVAAGEANITATLQDKAFSVTLAISAAPPVVVSIDVTPDAPSVAKGYSQQLAATAISSDDTKATVTNQATWASSDEAVAAVSNAEGSKGLVTAVSAGNATITATVGALAGSVSFHVSPEVLTALALGEGLVASAPKGLHVQLAATGTFSDTSTRDVTTDVTWTSSDGAVVTMSNEPGTRGRATAAGVGEAVITGTLGEKSVTVTFTTTPATVQSIRLAGAAEGLPVGLTAAVVATATLSDGSERDVSSEITLSSSDPGVASIVDGTPSVRGETEGAVTVTATLGGFTAVMPITVGPSVLVTMSITASAASLPKGRTIQLVATGQYSDGVEHDVTSAAVWTSTHAEIAAVSSASGSSGLVTALSEGLARITAVRSGVSAAFDVTVAPAVLSAIAIGAAHAELFEGASMPMTIVGMNSDGGIATLGAEVIWSSSDTSVLTVSNDAADRGVVTAVAAGSATITATSGGIVSTGYIVSVVPVVLVSLTLTAPVTSLAPGETVLLTVAGVNSDGSTPVLDANVTWTSSDSDIATISNDAADRGLVTAVSDGVATFTATVGTISSAPIDIVVATPAP